MIRITIGANFAATTIYHHWLSTEDNQSQNTSIKLKSALNIPLLYYAYPSVVQGLLIQLFNNTIGY